MTNKFFSLILSLCVLTFFSFSFHTNKVNANKNNSTVIWTGSKPTGSHTGNVSIKSGYLTFDHGRLVGGNFTIDMTSITCTDIEKESKNKYFVDHLKDEDFFDVTEFPEANLNIKKVKRLNAQEYEMSGEMTIKGITNDLTFTSEVKLTGNSYVAIAKIIIDRTKYGVEYKSANVFKNLGDKFIYDEIEFDIFLVSEK
mgnify:FL=1|tara:strand:+ start:516 stop:1109 length:594 start_codon:yes stop_codon:yes gene_type:complete